MKWNEDYVLIAVGMKRAGIPLKNIAKRLGCSKTEVSRKTIKVGVKFNTRMTQAALAAKRSMSLGSENDLCN